MDDERRHALRRVKAARAALKRRIPSGEWVPSDVIVAEMLAAADKVDRQTGPPPKRERTCKVCGGSMEGRAYYEDHCGALACVPY